MRDWLRSVLTLNLPPFILTWGCKFPTGGLCGSVFLDMNFERYIETICGETEYRSLKESNRKKMMREFDTQIKRCFNGHDDHTYSVDLKGVKEDPEHGVLDDTITIKPYVFSQNR